MHPVLKTKDLSQLIPDPISLRDRCIIKMFLYTTIRRHELLKLDIRNINFKTKKLTLRKRWGLTHKQFDLPEDLVQDLKKYVSGRKKGLLFSFSPSEGSSIRQLNNLLNYINKMQEDPPASEPWR